MINNIKIVKEENGNTSFIKNPSNLIDAFLPPVAGIRVNNKSNPDDSIIEIFSITGQKYTFLVSSIESTQIKPASAVPFSGTAEDLATLLKDSFFIDPSGSGLATELKQDEISNKIGLLVTETNFDNKVGEVISNPTANTLLARLKDIKDAVDSIPTEISFKDEALDMGHSLPTSQKSTLGNYVQHVDNLPLLLNRVGTGTQTYSEEKVLMAVGVGEYAICQSFKRHLYLAGKSQLAEITFSGFGLEAGVEKRIGYFSTSTTAPYNTIYDGIFLLNDGTDYFFVIAKNGTEVRINRDDWDDPLDGTGTSGVTLDFSKFTVMAIDFLYLGGTGARLRFDIGGTIFEAHKYRNSNVNTSTFIGSPTQPVRWEIRSTGGSGSMDQISAEVSSLGSLNVPGYPRSIDTGFEFINANDDDKPYLITAIRLNNPRSIVKLITGVALGTTNNSYIQKFILNPTIANEPAWTTLPNSPIDYIIGDVVNGNSNTTITGGIDLDTSFVSGRFREVRNELGNAFQLGMSVDGVYDVLALVAVPISTNLDLRGGMSFKII